VASKYGLQAGNRSLRTEDIEQSDMRDILSDDLGWKKKNSGFENRLISITSSPFFALQLAVQKHARMKREQRDAEKKAEKAAERKLKEADKRSETNEEPDGSEDSEDGPAKNKAKVNVRAGDIYNSTWTLRSCRKEQLPTKPMQ
jgi:hypothetical protein